MLCMHGKPRPETAALVSLVVLLTMLAQFMSDVSNHKFLFISFFVVEVVRGDVRFMGRVMQLPFSEKGEVIFLLSPLLLNGRVGWLYVVVGPLLHWLCDNEVVLRCSWCPARMCPQYVCDCFSPALSHSLVVSPLHAGVLLVLLHYT